MRFRKLHLFSKFNDLSVFPVLLCDILLGSELFLCMWAGEIPSTDHNTEGHWSSQAWFSFHKSMLTIPSHLLVLNVFWNVFQQYLLYYLPTDWGEFDWPVVPRTLLLVLLEDRSDICLFPMLKNIPTSEHFKDRSDIRLPSANSHL